MARAIRSSDRTQTDLRAELKKLYELNARISEEAGNLTKALKGDVKKQGNWGEVVLERILERSGLNEGEQGYRKQFSDKADDGKRIQPDIVINLPDKTASVIVRIQPTKCTETFVTCFNAAPNR